MEFIKLAEERYSCRAISDKPVEAEKVEKILEAGRIAPTAANRQPIHFWVLCGEQASENVKQTTRCDFGAFLFFVVGVKKEEAWLRPFDGHNFADVDGAIAATHMMLEIQDLGLNTTWVGHFDAQKLSEFYPDMKEYELIAMFPTGYAAENGGPAPKHLQRKETGEITTKHC